MKRDRPPLPLPQDRNARPRIENRRHRLPELPAVGQERRLSQDGSNLMRKEGARF